MVRPVNPETLARDNKAIRMRIERKTYQEIADTLGYSSAGAVHQQIQRRLKERKKAVEESADLHLSELLSELDAMAGEAWAVLNREHVLVSNGMVVRDVDRDGEGTGTRIRDDGPTLAAIDRLAKVLAQKAKLLGLEKPTGVEGGLTITINGVPESEMP